MILRKLSQSLRITLALMVATFSSGLLQPAVAYAVTTRTNAGDTKVVDELGGSEVPNNEPILTDCDLGVEFYNFVNTTDEIATVTFQPQAPTDDVIISVAGNQSPIVPGDGDGDPNGSNDLDGAHPYSLSFTGAPKTQGAVNGYHVKVLTDVSNTNGGAKQKVFWMPASCGTAPTPSAPTVLATAQACKQGDITTDVIVTVTNTNDATDEAETYDVTINGVKKTTASIADGSNGSVTFTGLPAGTHNVTVVGSDGTTASSTVTVTECTTAPNPATPTVLAAAQVCKQGNVTTDVLVTTTNTNDDTNEAETYEVTINGTKKTTALIADGTNGSVTFTGLPAGTHNVTVVGSDGTTASTTVTVTECGGRGGEDTNQGLCHATGSGKYVLIDDISSAGIFNGHYGGGTTEDAKGDHQNGEDIIPPFTYQGNEYSQHYDAAGMAIFAAGCVTPRTPTVCTVSNNTYLSPWAYGGVTNPGSGGGGSYEFKSDGLYISTPEVSSYVYGETSAGNTPLVDVDQMSYKTMRLLTSTGNNQVVTAFILQVDLDGVTSTTDDVTYLFYEPIYNGNVVSGTWQTWDTIDGGDAVYWSFELTDGNPTLTWDEILTEYPDAIALSYGFNQGTYNQGTNAAVQDIMFDCAKTSFGKAPVLGDNDVCPNIQGTQTTVPAGMTKNHTTGDCYTPGVGGGQTQGTSTTTPQTLGSAVLPAVLPATGANDSPLMILAAALLAYGAAYFLQGRRLITRKEMIGA